MDPASLVAELTAAVARSSPDTPLSASLCQAYVSLARATAGALTLSFGNREWLTLYATDELARRLEDLQDLVGEGPGHTAARSGQVEMAVVPSSVGSQWAVFSEAAQDIVGAVVIEAVPMKPSDEIFGVITLYQTAGVPLSLGRGDLQLLADTVGAALLGEGRDPLDEVDLRGAQARIHQATGMLVAELRIAADDALALLRAHAYAHQTTLSAISAAVVERRIGFPASD